MNYNDFLNKKCQLEISDGFNPVWIPDFLFDFQVYLVEWAIKCGRAAIFADCGLGKTPIQLVWGQNIVEKINKNILIMTPLSVSHQTIKEGEKFGIDVKKSNDGKPKGKITVTNYERLHLFDPDDYIGFIADESSILKNFDGKTKKLVTEFLKKKKYRLLCTATAAPNDYTELGTSSEALGVMGYMDMLNRFFKNDQNTCDTKSHYLNRGQKWRFKKHAEIPFWRWVGSWAKSIRNPSDLGFSDKNFILPELIENETVVDFSRKVKGQFLPTPALSLNDQRKERRETLEKRCDVVAEKVKGDKIAVVWCHLNDEGDYLEKIIRDSVQVNGSMSNDKKEDILINFSEGKIRVLITKPKISGFGLNWQHCNHTTFFPSHSFEQYYQGVRRFWRFGQINPVTVDIVTSKGELRVLANQKRKALASDKMYKNLNKLINNSLKIENKSEFNQLTEGPSWV